MVRFFILAHFPDYKSHFQILKIFAERFIYKLHLCISHTFLHGLRFFFYAHRSRETRNCDALNCKKCERTTYL